MEAIWKMTDAFSKASEVWVVGFDVNASFLVGAERRQRRTCVRWRAAEVARRTKETGP